MKTALIVIDVQNDFCPGGALAVTGGNDIVPVINQQIGRYDYTVATQDWHPANHGSFASAQGKKVFELGELGGQPQMMWPDHCVQDTEGAVFHPGLAAVNFDAVFPKGQNPEIDSYSGFYDNDHQNSTGLAEWLKEREVTDVILCGLAVDYCVKATALDAVKEGFKVTLMVAGCRGVNMKPGDSSHAIEEMETAGVVIDRDLGT